MWPFHESPFGKGSLIANCLPGKSRLTLAWAAEDAETKLLLCRAPCFNSCYMQPYSCGNICISRQIDLLVVGENINIFVRVKMVYPFEHVLFHLIDML